MVVNPFRRHDFSRGGFNDRTVIICDQVYFSHIMPRKVWFFSCHWKNLVCHWIQCEREYHVGCLRDHKMADLKVPPYLPLLNSLFDKHEKKSNPMHEAPANVEFQGRIYCMQFYSVLQEVVFMTWTCDFQVTW